MIAPGVLLQKYRHGLQRSYAVRGPDVMGESPEVQGALMLRANEVLKRLGGSWMLQSEAQRQRVTTLPTVAWPSPVLALLDQERRQGPAGGTGEPGDPLLHDAVLVAAHAQHAELATGPGLRRPASRRQREAEEEGSTSDQRVSLLEFVREADAFMDLLKGMLAVCRPLTIDETMTYLHNCVSESLVYARADGLYHDLDAQLCDTPFVGGLVQYLGVDPTSPRLARADVLDYGLSGDSRWSAWCRHLDAANVDYRWCTRWVGLEKHVQAGMLRKTQGAWMGQEKSFWGASRRAVSHQPHTRAQHRRHEQSGGSRCGAAGRSARISWPTAGLPVRSRSGTRIPARPRQAAPGDAGARQSGLYDDGGTAACDRRVAVESSGQSPR